MGTRGRALLVLELRCTRVMSGLLLAGRTNKDSVRRSLDLRFAVISSRCFVIILLTSCCLYILLVSISLLLNFAQLLAGCESEST